MLLFLLALLPSAAHAVPDAEACARFTTSIERLKEARPKALVSYVGSTTDRFPCPSAGWESAGPELNVLHAKAGQRRVVLLLKRAPKKEEIVDVLLLPALAPREIFFGPSRCKLKATKASAVAVGEVEKDHRTVRLRAAWRVDREEEMLPKVKASGVACEISPENGG